MSSSSHGKAVSSSSQRIHEFLSGLQEEFKHKTNNGSSPRRFNVYLEGLKVEFELMRLEIESLQKERDKYQENAKELRNVAHKFVCERCQCSEGTTSLPQIPSSSSTKSMNATPSFFSKPQFKSLNKLRANLTLKTPTRQSTDSTQHTTFIQKLHTSITLTRSPPSSAAVITPPSPLLQAFVPTIDQRNWSIEFNNEARKELCIEIVHELCHEDYTLSVQFSRDGKSLAVGCYNGTAYIYDVQTGTLTHVLRDLVAQDSIRIVCFSHDGKYLAIGYDKGVYIWEINTRYVRNIFREHYAFSLDFSSNGRLLASTSINNVVRLWSMRDGIPKLLIEDNPGPTFPSDRGFSSASFSPDGSHVAASHFDGIVRIWDARTCQLMRRVRAHLDWVNHVAFIPDGKGLVSSSSDGTLRYWDISSLCTARFRARSHTMRDLSREATGVEEQTRHEREFLGHECYLTSVVMSPDGRWIASGSDGRCVGIWDCRNGAMQCSVKHDNVWTADFSPTGHYFASGGHDGMVRIWKYSSISGGGPQRIHG